MIGINARYSHQNLAIEYIKKYNKDIDLKNIEFNINQAYDRVYGDIIKEEADVICFSTYIWNVDMILRLSSDLKKANPDSFLILGGPEVSFDTEEILKENEGVDIIIRGEGEETTRVLFNALINRESIENIKGISYRKNNEIIKNPERELIKDLDIMPSPYDEDYKAPKGKMVYYEMSRGCPFKCAYCLSSTIKGVRYFSKERIKSDILNLINSGSHTIKLVDRTFNSNEDFSIEIMNFIKEQKVEGVTFHMELMAHLISDRFLEFLSTMPKGLFQFEVGIQSSNKKTLKEIYRVTDLKRLSHVVKTIKSFGNIHQHVDLIAGLPYEDYESFKDSFNFAYSLNAEKLQLGFLKLLRGSDLRKRGEDFDIVYSDYPPYEVISTKWLSPIEIYRLKLIEDLVEKYSNEDYFKWTIDYLIEEDPFSFFEEFSYFWEENNYHKVHHSRGSLYKILYDYIQDRPDREGLIEVIRLDYMLNENKPPKKYLNPQNIDTKIEHDLLHDEKIRKSFGLDMSIPTKKLIKDFQFQGFGFGGQRRIFGFYYKNSGTIRVDIIEDYERIKDELY